MIGVAGQHQREPFGGLGQRAQLLVRDRGRDEQIVISRMRLQRLGGDLESARLVSGLGQQLNQRALRLDPRRIGRDRPPEHVLGVGGATSGRERGGLDHERISRSCVPLRFAQSQQHPNGKLRRKSTGLELGKLSIRLNISLALNRVGNRLPADVL